MKVLFLDFDGVLNTPDFYSWAQENAVDYWEEVSPLHCAKLDLLWNEVPDVKIVVSSSWRLMGQRTKTKEETIEYLKGVLKRSTLQNWDKVIDITPYLPNEERGIEIQAWLDDHPEVTHFAILDDDNDMAHLRDTKHFIRTDMADGVTRENVQALIKVFKNDVNN